MSARVIIVFLNFPDICRTIEKLLATEDKMNEIEILVIDSIFFLPDFLIPNLS